LYGDNFSVEADLNRHFSRYEDPLWDEGEGGTRGPPITRITRTGGVDNCIFNIMNNTKVVYSIDCKKLTKRQAKFLQTTEGMQFLLLQFKNGVKNMSGLKKVMGEDSVKNKMRQK